MTSEGVRSQLYEDLFDAMRENASRTLMLHQGVAERFGLNPTDIKCLDLARDEERLTAGRLAELTGLRTSSVTAVLDRLEARGLVERRRDPADRRKVIVAATGAHLAEGAAIFDELAARVRRILDGYDEATLTGFLAVTRELSHGARDFTAELTAQRRDVMGSGAMGSDVTTRQSRIAPGSTK